MGFNISQLFTDLQKLLVCMRFNHLVVNLFIAKQLLDLILFSLFLIRDSQSNPKAFALTLCHHQKIKHFQILPVSIACP